MLHFKSSVPGVWSEPEEAEETKSKLWNLRSLHFLLFKKSTDAEGDFLDQIFPEAMLQAVKDFLAAVTDDFRQPHAGVHVHKERALVQIMRLRVRGEGRVNE